MTAHVTTGSREERDQGPRDEEPYPGIPTCNPVTLQITLNGYQGTTTVNSKQSTHALRCPPRFPCHNSAEGSEIQFMLGLALNPQQSWGIRFLDWYKNHKSPLSNVGSNSLLGVRPPPRSCTSLYSPTRSFVPQHSTSPNTPPRQSVLWFIAVLADNFVLSKC